MFHEYFQVGVVWIQLLFLVSADVTRQLRGHLVHTPPGEWFLQKHLPSAGVNCLAEFQRARLPQPVGECAALIVKTQSDEQAQSSNDGDGDANTPQPPVVRAQDENP